MVGRPSRATCAHIRVFALALVVGGAQFLDRPALAWPLSGGDVAIDNFAVKTKEGGQVTIAHADFANTNLSKDEILALLTPDTPDADRFALAKKFKADKVAIPTIDFTNKDGGKFHIHDVAASKIDAGKVESFSFASIDGAGQDKDGAVTVKSGAFKVDGLDVAAALKVIGAPSETAAGPGRLGHLSWQSVDIVGPEGSGAPSKTIHVAIGSFEVNSDYAGDAFRQGTTKIVGLVIEPSPDSDAGQNLASLGYSRLELAAAIGARYQADAKTLSLDELTVDGAQMGSVGLKANFSDVAPSLFSADEASRMQALLGAGVMSLQIKVVNAGLFEKALALTAKQQGASPDALRQQWSMMVGQMAPLFLGGDPSALKVASEAQKFIASPKNLTIDIKAKNGALKAGDFMAASDPTALMGKVDISAAANQ